MRERSSWSWCLVEASSFGRKESVLGDVDPSHCLLTAFFTLFLSCNSYVVKLVLALNVFALASGAVLTVYLKVCPL